MKRRIDFSFGIRIERIRSGLTTNLVAGADKASSTALDFVAEELEAESDMNNPRLLRGRRFESSLPDQQQHFFQEITGTRILHF